MNTESLKKSWLALMAHHPMGKEVVATATAFMGKVHSEIKGKDYALFQQAMDLMFQLHCDQKDRPDGKPYVSHTLSVGMKVFHLYDHSKGELQEVLTAGLLHDSLEDQMQKLARISKLPSIAHEEAAAIEIVHRFGLGVWELLVQLTNPNFDELLQELGIGKDDTQYRAEKNKLYAAHVEDIIQKYPLLIIKLADFTENAPGVSLLPEETVEQKNKKLKLAQKYLPVIPIFMEKISGEEPFQEYATLLRDTAYKLAQIS